MQFQEKKMSPKTIKERAKQLMDNLSTDKAKLILNFIEYLNEKEEWAATKEILSNKEMMEDIKICDEDLTARRMDEFVSWDEVQRKRCTK